MVAEVNDEPGLVVDVQYKLTTPDRELDATQLERWWRGGLGGRTLGR